MPRAGWHVPVSGELLGLARAPHVCPWPTAGELGADAAADAFRGSLLTRRSALFLVLIVHKRLWNVALARSGCGGGRPGPAPLDKSLETRALQRTCGRHSLVGIQTQRHLGFFFVRV